MLILGTEPRVSEGTLKFIKCARKREKILGSSGKNFELEAGNTQIFRYWEFLDKMADELGR